MNTQYIIDVLQKVINSTEMILNNEYVVAVLAVVLILYGSLIAPKLPASITHRLDNNCVRFAVFFAIALLASKNAVIALVAALAVAVTLQTINYHRVVKTSVSVSTKPSTYGESSVVDATVVSPLLVAAPKQAVVDTAGNTVRDAAGKTVMAAPTVVQDQKGNIVRDSNGQPVVVAPTVAVDKNGDHAKDNSGVVIVAPPKVTVDETGNIAKDHGGNMVMSHGKVSVDNDNRIYIISGHHGAGESYGDMNAAPAKSDAGDMGEICDNKGGGCLQGYEDNIPASFA
ncbi:MAG: hypothetical protein Faunusvirus6_5 [Faunusvirus sp.]|jgi:hypothetical protein|uniref:Uncharacterized protein n=1 Tax=Faunusvirus sp. TaxID=2487766 RepID=A0A3G4ZWE8_9VIRU|nr:MAG: hypothetical protein Faunusvirus6_5 [Faunusvirus sp.]